MRDFYYTMLFAFFRIKNSLFTLLPVLEKSQTLIGLQVLIKAKHQNISFFFWQMCVLPSNSAFRNGLSYRVKVRVFNPNLNPLVWRRNLSSAFLVLFLPINEASTAGNVTDHVRGVFPSYPPRGAH